MNYQDLYNFGAITTVSTNGIYSTGATFGGTVPYVDAYGRARRAPEWFEPQLVPACAAKEEPTDLDWLREQVDEVCALAFAA
jgi:hypothetical protein